MNIFKGKKAQWFGPMLVIIALVMLISAGIFIIIEKIPFNQDFGAREVDIKMVVDQGENIRNYLYVSANIGYEKALSEIAIQGGAVMDCGEYLGVKYWYTKSKGRCLMNSNSIKSKIGEKVKQEINVDSKLFNDHMEYTSQREGVVTKPLFNERLPLNNYDIFIKDNGELLAYSYDNILFGNDHMKYSFPANFKIIKDYDFNFYNDTYTKIDEAMKKLADEGKGQKESRREILADDIFQKVNLGTGVEIKFGDHCQQMSNEEKIINEFMSKYEYCMRTEKGNVCLINLTEGTMESVVKIRFEQQEMNFKMKVSYQLKDEEKVSKEYDLLGYQITDSITKYNDQEAPNARAMKYIDLEIVYTSSGKGTASITAIDMDGEEHKYNYGDSIILYKPTGNALTFVDDGLRDSFVGVRTTVIAEKDEEGMIFCIKDNNKQFLSFEGGKYVKKPLEYRFAWQITEDRPIEKLGQIIVLDKKLSEKSLLLRIDKPKGEVKGYNVYCKAIAIEDEDKFDDWKNYITGKVLTDKQAFFVELNKCDKEELKDTDTVASLERKKYAIAVTAVNVFNSENEPRIIFTDGDMPKDDLPPGNATISSVIGGDVLNSEDGVYLVQAETDKITLNIDPLNKNLDGTECKDLNEMIVNYKPRDAAEFTQLNMPKDKTEIEIGGLQAGETYMVYIVGKDDSGNVLRYENLKEGFVNPYPGVEIQQLTYS